SVADLAAHGFDPDSSAGLIIDAARQGLRGERLLDVSTAVLHELQRGHSRAEALAVVRRELPNVPAPPKPARASVAGAGRPGAWAGAGCPTGRPRPNRRGRASRGRAGPRRGRRLRRDARYSLKPPSLARAPFRCA